MALRSDQTPRARPGEVVAGSPSRTRSSQEIQSCSRFIRTGNSSGRGGGLPVRSISLVCGALGLASVVGPANAQVIEVQSDGAAAVYAGPVVSSGQGRAPIAPPAARPNAGHFHAARPAASAAVSDAIRQAADRRQLSARLIEAVAWQESRLNQKAVSPKGALGVMQLRPQTAAGLGVDPSDLHGNVDGGAAYLGRLLQQFDGDIVLTLAAYNAGPEAVRRYGGVPPYPETRAYVAAVLDRLAEMDALTLERVPARWSPVRRQGRAPAKKSRAFPGSFEPGNALARPETR